MSHFARLVLLPLFLLGTFSAGFVCTQANGSANDFYACKTSSPME
jgi:hypothetical protein